MTFRFNPSNLKYNFMKLDSNWKTVTKLYLDSTILAGEHSASTMHWTVNAIKLLWLLSWFHSVWIFVSTSLWVAPLASWHPCFYIPPFALISVSEKLLTISSWVSYKINTSYLSVIKFIMAMTSRTDHNKIKLTTKMAHGRICYWLKIDGKIKSSWQNFDMQNLIWENWTLWK